MDGNRSRRQFLTEMGAGAAWTTLAAAPEPGLATTLASISVRAGTTNLTSSNDREISYRHQQHLVQSADGALHLLFNRGSLTPGPGLSLFSSLFIACTARGT